MIRSALISHLASVINDVTRTSVVKVAIDGAMASGKSIFAAEISNELEELGANNILCSVDDFFNSRKIRYSRGFDSAMGCYLDTVDIEGLTEAVLKPLSPGGDGRIKKAIFDAEMDQAIESSWFETKPDDILIFEGVFLQVPKLDDYWDLRIFIKADPDVALSRALERDVESFNDSNELIEKHEIRYRPAQELYLRQVSPEANADIVVDNNDYNFPRIVDALR